MKMVERELAVDQFVAARMVRPNYLTQRINHYRRLGDAVSPNASTREEIELSSRLKETHDGQTFLLGDTKGANRVMSFATDNNLDLLSKQKRWYGDATFQVSPSLFKQVYTVNVIFKGKCLPMTFSLLPDKKTESYREMFLHIGCALTSCTILNWHRSTRSKRCSRMQLLKVFELFPILTEIFYSLYANRIFF